VSDFSDAFEAGPQEHLQSVFGEAITVTPPGGSAVSIADAIWGDETSDQRVGADGEVSYRQVSVQVNTDDVASPERLSVVIRFSTGESWTVTDVAPLEGGATMLLCIRSSVAEKAGKGYRLHRRQSRYA